MKNTTSYTSMIFFYYFMCVCVCVWGGGGARASRLTASNCAIISEKEGNLSLISSLRYVPK